MSKMKLAVRRESDMLRFTPYAYAKLIYLRDIGTSEVGGFGLSASSDDLLLVKDILLVEQKCSSLSVSFSDEGVADYFDRMVDQGYHPEEFGRIWIHTHPGFGADPSSVDERTFDEIFGRCDWSVMFIQAKGSRYYARLQIRNGLQISQSLRCAVDMTQDFPGADKKAWREEYEKYVKVVRSNTCPNPYRGDSLPVLKDSRVDDLSKLNDPFYWGEWECSGSWRQDDQPDVVPF